MTPQELDYFRRLLFAQGYLERYGIFPPFELTEPRKTADQWLAEHPSDGTEDRNLK